MRKILTSSLFVSLLLASAAATAQAAKDVNVVNTPNVNVVNNPPLPVPFQQLVNIGNIGGGSESCVALTVPAGKTLLLESLSFEATVIAGSTVEQQQIYVRVDHHVIFDGGGSSTSFFRFGAGSLVTLGNRGRGIYAFKLYATPNVGTTFDVINVCTTNANVSAYASGQILD